MSELEACKCWVHVVGHEGHCCFGPEYPIEDYRLGQPAPCGHADPHPELRINLTTTTPEGA
ncbi:MAG TPA: hypothetical protein VIP28_05040 [Nocardioides sp.]